MTTKELTQKISQTMDGLDIDAEHFTSFDDTQSELVKRIHMKGISKGYDPELGKKFSQESSGLVIGRAKSSPRKSEAQVRQDWIEEYGRAPDAQQLHDAMMTSGSPTPGELEEMASRQRWTLGRNQGLREQASKDSPPKSGSTES